MGHRELLLALATGLTAISALGGAWVGAGWLWDGANAAGFVAAVILIFLHIETGAGRTKPLPHAPFHARLHTNIALLALAFVGIHAGVLLADDVTTLEYWKVSAPPYMLAGIGALVLMSAITGSAYARPRRRLFPTHLRFRRIHGVASLVLAALVTWHVVGSALYLDTGLKRTLGAAVLAAWPTWLVVRSARRLHTSRRPTLEGTPRPVAEATRETLRIGVAGLAFAIVFSAARNLPLLFQ